MSSNWLSWFKTAPRDTERAEMLAQVAHLRSIQQLSPFTTEQTIHDFIIDIIADACDEHGGLPGVPLGQALYNLIFVLLQEDAIIGVLQDDEEVSTAPLEESVRLRATFRRHERFLNGHKRLLPIWKDKVTIIIRGMLNYLPDSAFIDADEDGKADDDSVVFPKAHAFDLCEELPEFTTRLIRTFFDSDVTDALLFEAQREAIDRNAFIASGIDPNNPHESSKELIMPLDSKLKEPAALVDMYLQGTPLHDFMYTQLPFAIPFPARFEHTHIVGGTGHGKTQLIQFLIHHDLIRSQEDGRSIVVLDSQGDLIQTISHLKLFAEPEFADRFVLVDPNDIEFPVCLNMFDFNRDRLSSYSALDQEKILNATIELYEYFFGALLGAELTQRQGLIFRYLARLLMEIPNATIHTLRELMEDGESFRPYMEKLTGSSRNFFATQFFEKKFGETKKQILTRLWGVLSNSSLERMFSHTENKIDIFELLNQGKIILINTAKDLLGQEGSAIFGRFFIALIAQAAIQRTALKPHERRSAFVYIDEAQDYFDDNISNLLSQARKYRVGLVFAHQNLDQLGAGLRASVLASTTIKFAGGMSVKDASALASEYRTASVFLLGQKKEKDHAEFACYVKNYTKTALSVSIPFLFMEGQAQIGSEQYRLLIDRNRELYSEPPIIPEDAPFPEFGVKTKPGPNKVEPRTETILAPKLELDLKELESESRQVLQTKVPKSPPFPKEAMQSGRGGRQHKYIQQLVKQLAEERGFRATIEETILEGAGRVDVSLVRDGLRIAVQVSVTTTKDWELGGVEKCLAAGYTKVILIGGTKRHTKGLETFIEVNLDSEDQGKVVYLTSVEVVEYLDGFGLSEPSEQVVRGYKVRTVQQGTDSEDAHARRKAISEVIAKSLLIK